MSALLRASPAIAVAMALCAAPACGGGASAEVTSALRRGELELALRLYEAQGGRDRASLVAIAHAVLAREARSAEPGRSAQAFAALRQAGTAARPVLERLAADARPAVAAQALAALASLGDAEARGRLLGLRDSADPAIAAAAVTALDAEADAAELRALLDSPAAAVRIAAVQRLGHAPHDRETVRVLARSAQHDPEPAVRSAALFGLARQGEAGARALAARLRDREAEQRAAAAAALVAADVAFARKELAPWLASEVTPEAIDAARALLASAPAETADAARALLGRGLAHADPQLRGRAACALPSLRDPMLAAAAVERAAREPVRSVRLCLILAVPAEHAAAARLLRELAGERDVPAAQAAAELGRRGDAGAPGRLQELLARGDPAVRRVAARALARDLDRPHDVRAALRDPDPGVRIAAAAAIASPIARSRTS